MKKFFAIATGLLMMAACAKEPQSQVTPTPGTAPEFTPTAIRIAPVMTKVTETAFENGDAIGLTVTRGAAGAEAPSAWASNKKLTFNGLEFTSDLLWYPEGTDEATLAAYYPYIAEGVPATFTVAIDQADGIQDSDLIAAVKSGVLPTANAVTMPFKHKLSRL
ncbi:MAG: fimbrillin family protein, partial [Bacteroidales bacterium]|nr:fimbrillin family protein [Bacteroidales bacterium]